MRRERYWRMVMVGLCLMLAALACTNPLSGNPQVEEAEATEEIEETEEAAEEAVETEEAAETEEVVETEEAVEPEEVEETEEAEETEEPTVESEAGQGETPDSRPSTASPDLTPTPEPEPEIDLPQSYHNQEGGYSLSLPAAWVTMEFDEAIAYAAPNQEAINQLDNEGIITSPVIMMAVGPPEIMDIYGEGDTASDIARLIIGELKEEPELTVSKPANLTVGGLDAVSFDISGWDEFTEQFIATRMIIVVGTEQAGMFYGVSLLEDWEEFSPIFDAVIDSVEFSGYTQ